MTKQDKDQYLATLGSLHEKTKAAINEVLKAFTPEDADINFKVQEVFSSVNNLQSLAKLVTEAEWAEMKESTENYADVCKKFVERKELAHKNPVSNIDQDFPEDPEALETEKFFHINRLAAIFFGASFLAYGYLIYANWDRFSYRLVYSSQAEFTIFFAVVSYALYKIIYLLKKPATG